MAAVVEWRVRVVGALLLLTAAALGLAGGWERTAAQDGGRAVAIVAGHEHACALLDSGTVQCWGDNWLGQTETPSGRFSAVSAGGFHTCGLRDSGTVECWGEDGYGATDVPSGRFSVVSAGFDHTCGLRDSGEVECWGDNERSESDAPSGRFSAVSAGSAYTCGLRENGEVECWSYTFEGQARPAAGKYVQVSSGYFHACALSEAGAISCWMMRNSAADVPAWLRDDAGGAMQAFETEPARGRIIARRLADGRTEFGWQPAGAVEPILPRARYFPVSATVDRWLRSTPVEVDGAAIGRIEARRRADGRIEFAFTPTGGERILPPSRYFSVSPTTDRWLRSTEIEVSGG